MTTNAKICDADTKNSLYLINKNKDLLCSTG